MSQINECPEHGLRTDANAETNNRDRCPACMTDMEVRLRGEVPGHPNDYSVRSPIPEALFAELYQIVREYLESNQDEVEIYASLDRYPGDLPAGYTETERVFNVLVYRFGARIKAVDSEPNARETIETLREHGFGEDVPEAAQLP